VKNDEETTQNVKDTTTMTDTKTSVLLDRTKLIAQLRELIVALDNRVPQLEREGETRIADEAAALRQKALVRIAELEAS
jgi:hypothetical protein